MNHLEKPGDTVLHRGPRITLVRRDVPTRDGGTAHKEIARHPGSVVLVPVTDAGELVLIRNERVAVGRTLWELPAGTLEVGEDPAECAARELEEETGYTAREITPLRAFFPAPGTCDERMHAYVATGLRAGVQKLDATERIEPVALPEERVLSMLRSGEIEDGKTIACVLLWRLTRGAP